MLRRPLIGMNAYESNDNSNIFVSSHLKNTYVPHALQKRSIKSNSKINKQNINITTSDLLNINPFYKNTSKAHSSNVSPAGRNERAFHKIEFDPIDLPRIDSNEHFNTNNYIGERHPSRLRGGGRMNSTKSDQAETPLYRDNSDSRASLHKTVDEQMLDGLMSVEKYELQQRGPARQSKQHLVSVTDLHESQLHHESALTARIGDQDYSDDYNFIARSR